MWAKRTQKTFDPLLIPAPESLLTVARQAAHNLRLPAVRSPDGKEQMPRIVEGVIVPGDARFCRTTPRGSSCAIRWAPPPLKWEAQGRLTD
ncbi:MAG: hypothetical protein K2Y23_23570 [Cyanobacteria bacterium]|nr:hypothetical protein [Cyanobacteriota bacterium]